MCKTSQQNNKMLYAEDGIPVFLVKRAAKTRVDEVATVSFKCPKCRKKNIHGGCNNSKGGGDGHRVSHCPCWPNGYAIKEV